MERLKKMADISLEVFKKGFKAIALLYIYKNKNKFSAHDAFLG
jgi:hypothetical protein